MYKLCDIVRTRCTVLSVSRSLLSLYVNAQHPTEADTVAMVTRRRRTEVVICLHDPPGFWLLAAFYSDLSITGYPQHEGLISR